jgi:hypothetical protein
MCKKKSWTVSEVLFGHLVGEGETEEYNGTQHQNSCFPFRGSTPRALEYETGVNSDLIYTALFDIVFELCLDMRI